ncbi:membrane protein [Microbacterium phage Pumpernickel]|uniref:Membrane protein n=1 Tax=Microbacterium phage Pumpernickel TaxID=2885983 RepID=A0AAE9C3K8_9CAUD|nr:membrane protein [Microbacterium phage Pumpernickel]YP_010755301.1 membrane protein [Microbacterium phage Pumpernickel]UDL15801.1 membrane protein [Microbacterium phage Pumpernickel]UDL16061.1 membrane protein [Microbacterium phage Pumpernickel]
MGSNLNGKYKLGPFEFKMSNISMGTHIFLLLLVFAIALGFAALAFWLFIANFMIIFQDGDFNWVNVFWLAFSGAWLVSLFTSNSKS